MLDPINVHSFIKKANILFLLLLTFNSLWAKTNSGEHDTLTVGIKVAPPFIIENIPGVYSGVSVELWDIIASKLDINYKLKSYKQSEFAKMLKDVENGELDISINPITVTGARIQRMDFTQPFYTSNLAIAVRIKNTNSFFELASKLFVQKNLLFVLVITIFTFVFGLSIWFIEKKNNSKEFRKGINGIGDGIWWAATIMTSIGSATKSPRSFLGRSLGIIWMFAAIITISILIGSVASSLTADRIISDINSINSLKRKKTGIMSGTNPEQFLINNFIPIANTGYNTIADGVFAVANNEIQVFVYNEPILKYIIQTEQLNDRVYIPPLKLNADYYSFALPISSILTDKINVVLVPELENINWKAIKNRYNLD